MDRPSSFKDLLRKPLGLFGGAYKTASGFLMFEGETLIHQQKDKWGNIHVVDHAGQRVMSFDSIYEQSRMDLQYPAMLVHQYTRAMLLGLTLGNPHHVTLFGLGGACLVRATHMIDPHIRIQAVELREAVVNVAQEYFGIPHSTNIAIQVADARQYITRQADASTDLIFADMYHAISADPFQMQKKFFCESHRILSADGWLVINCHELPPPESFFFRTLRFYFKEILMCAVPGGNFVFYASKSGRDDPNALQPSTVEFFELKTRTELHFLLEKIVKLRVA